MFVVFEKNYAIFSLYFIFVYKKLHTFLQANTSGICSHVEILAKMKFLFLCFDFVFLKSIKINFSGVSIAFPNGNFNETSKKRTLNIKFLLSHDRMLLFFAPIYCLEYDFITHIHMKNTNIHTTRMKE